MADTIIFSGSLSFYLNLTTTLLDIIILAIVARIPFKRNYHFTFLVFMASFTWFAATGTIEQGSGSVEGYYFWLAWQGIGVSYGSLALLYLFILQFKSQKAEPWQKIALVAAFGLYFFYAIAALVDESFIYKPFGRTHPTGYSAIAGPFQSLVSSSGINYPLTIITVLILYEVVQYYRSTKAPLTRTQLKYLLVAVLLIYIGQTGSQITMISQNIPAGLIQVSRAAAALVFLTGLTRHGFYSVTPVAETATVGEQMRYPLEDGHAYMGLDQKTSFTLLSDLVRSGRNGLCITTTPPDEVRDRYRFEKTPIKWLAQSEKSEVINPGDLVGVSSLITKFIQKAERPVVLLDGIDYLVSSNGFRPTMALINKVSKTNSAKRGIFLVSSPVEGPDMGPPAPLDISPEASLVQARLKGPHAIEVGETVEFQLDIFNVGLGSAVVEEVDGIVPERFTPVAAPKYCEFKGSSLFLHDKKLEPLQTESIVFSLRANEPGEATLNPKLSYRASKADGESFYSMQPLHVLVSPPQKLEFDTPESKSIFSYLVREFTNEYMVRKQSLDQSGWRSLPDIADNTRIPRSTLYGNNGKYGRSVFELLSRGLIEERMFAEGRGRTRETAKLRISYDRDPVKRIVDKGILEWK